ncbi:TPA: hypothetical protein OMS38_002420 [Klebsiella aerogenes]|uniref:hypothetical protein n=1 Tax=Klebsiella aerogenes TaxID=548 RepID=UPI004043CEA6|nr:hypothetical protein [Klebsiella aerogenes]HCR0958170.1 hypothetical protein [Klebsiella aerogenes]
MTWSKVVSFIINLIGSSLISFILSKGAWDVKIAGSVYAAYTLLYILFSDYIASFDKNTSVSKARTELEDTKKMLLAYEICMLDVHHCALNCITKKLKGDGLIYQLNFIITMLSEVKHNASNTGNEYKRKEPKSDDMADFIAEK